jgi:hypothetical protein
MRVEIFGQTDLSVGYGNRSPKLPAASYSDLPTSVPDILVPALVQHRPRRAGAVRAFAEERYDPG